MIAVTAPGASIVAEIHVAPGDAVAQGAALITTELMKMRHTITAPDSGIIQAIAVDVGAELADGQPLLTMTQAPVDAAPGAPPPAPRPELEEFRARMRLLEDAARPDAVARRHAAGQRTARENIDALFDAGSFTEYGALAVAAQRSAKPLDSLQATSQGDGIICGIGSVAGRPVAAMAVDYMVMAGTQGYNHHRKMDRLIAVAGRDRLPIVLFAEGGGGRPNDVDAAPLVVAGLNTPSFARFAAYRGPKIGIASGFCFAGNAALFGMCDLRIGTRNSWIGMGGPAMIEGGGLGRVRPDQIGPSDVQAANGVLDLLVEDEAAAVSAAGTLLALPQPGRADTPDADLRQAIPAERTLAYDMRDVIAGLADPGSFLELRAGFGRGMICGFARIRGRALGLLANNPLNLGGAIDAEAADKGARFLQLCDAWGLPAVTLCDTPGFMVGPGVEETGQVAHVSRLFLAGAHFAQPLVTVILRKAYGLGAMAMAGGGFERPHYCCAWPTGEIGAMGLEGAVKLGQRDRLVAIADPAAREAEYQRQVAKLYAAGKALNAASLLEFDAVIDPSETRAHIERVLASAGPCQPGPRYVDAW